MCFTNVIIIIIMIIMIIIIIIIIIIITSSNRRLRECVRLVALYQTAKASGSQVVTKETKAFESFAFP